jgi:hypothetical protein
MVQQLQQLPPLIKDVVLDSMVSVFVCEEGLAHLLIFEEEKKKRMSVETYFMLQFQGACLAANVSLDEEEIGLVSFHGLGHVMMLLDYLVAGVVDYNVEHVWFVKYSHEMFPRQLFTIPKERAIVKMNSLREAVAWIDTFIRYKRRKPVIKALRF